MKLKDLTYRYGKMRFWEMLPGILAWSTFLLALLFSVFKPYWAIIFIIIFDLYWLFRVIYFIIFLFVSWRAYRRTIKINWQAKLENLPRAQRIHHLIFLPTYQEDYEIVKTTFTAIKNSAFPNDRIFIVLGGEERDETNFRRIADRMQSEFAGTFKKIMICQHPKDLADEIPGKGSNLNWSGHRAAEILSREYPEIADEDLVVSSFDVDTIAHAQYYSYLTYLYCTVERPERCSYQPVALFSNNIWTAPALVRIAAFGTTFWLMGELSRPERLWTFSSHSMPWKMLKDVDFWQKNIVSEDSRIFMQAFVEYSGDYRVIPMYLPVSMDTVTGRNFWEYVVALYKQQRRWAWGVEHLPIMVEAFNRDQNMPARLKRKYIFNHIEGMFTWATAPILIFVLGWLPLRLAYESQALVQAAPFTLQALMQLAMAGVFVSGFLAMTLLPPRPAQVKKWTWLVMVLQWALLPITFIVFGAIPAIDAQTRLMIGKYLGFNVTKKTRQP
ncbi:glycosyltransferase family 2 protein [Patescibacteria group bacterium]|nr:glycosyltransferase family 2 protein [Patescibacteria group bacterium]MBU1705749.1 glycosyltransferase family 2 protein [Patescibacteria group bacterium]